MKALFTITHRPVQSFIIPVIILVALNSVSATEIIFSEHNIISSLVRTPVHAVGIDIDGDGDKDVVSASAEGVVAWQENSDGFNTSNSQIIITSGLDHIHTVFSIDIDGDEDNDVIVSTSSYSPYVPGIAWYENIDGLGNFDSEANIIHDNMGTTLFNCVDIDVDGDIDVVSASGSSIYWYENTDGTGFYMPALIIATDVPGVSTIFCADLDGDEDFDVLTGSTVNDRVAWYENVDGSGTFGEPQVIDDESNNYRSVICIDLDNDGDNDVISASDYWGEAGGLSWFENIDGLGNFGPYQTIDIDARYANSVISNDFDGDGDNDVIINVTGEYWEEDSRIVWYENTDGMGTFQVQQIISTDENLANSIYCTDLDNDNDVDLLTASPDNHQVAWYENEDGLGSFGSRLIISSLADAVQSIFSTDLDGDGDKDVLSASPGDNKIAWYENTDGFGSFGQQQVISIVTDEANSVYSADLDSDGDNDVLSASTNIAEIAWYENTDGLGNFSDFRVISSDAEGATSVFSVDIDGDGDYDVLSASYAFWLLEGKIAWYENLDGFGDFGPQQVISNDIDGTNYLFSADIDDDGDFDVLSATTGEYIPNSRVCWYENVNGLGDFGPQQVISNEVDGANCVFCGDIDGDGDLDVLSSSFGGWMEDSKIAWYENTDGLGNFGPQRIITTEVDRARSVFCVDLDLDGDNDVLSASEEDDIIAWYENTDGFGDFGERQVISFESDGAVSVLSTDIDGDGIYDVIAASKNDGKIAWFRNEEINGIEELERWDNEIPSSFVLQSVYPNPFNAIATITVGLPTTSDLSLQVYNALGQEVAKLTSGQHTAGYHSFVFDGHDLSSGIYFIRASVPGKMDEIRKVVLMK